MQVDSPEGIYRHPASRFVADFVGSSNVLPPQFVERLNGESRWASLRPEAVNLVNEGGLRATVTGRSFLGVMTKISLNVEGYALSLLAPSSSVLPEEGMQVRVNWQPTDLHLMEAK